MKCFVLVLYILMGCSQSLPSKSQGYVESYQAYTLWPNPKDIPVCWEPGDSFSQLDRQRVADAIETQYRRAGLGFRFQAECIDKAPGIHVKVDAEGLDYTSYIGALLDGKSAGMHLNWAKHCKKDIPDSTCLINTALHEFGHALGFHHEMNRRDHSDCSKDQTEGRGEDSALQIGLYDKNSIMSYCRDRNTEVLSDNDLAAFADYYFSPVAKISGGIPMESAQDLSLLIEGLDLIAYKWLVTNDSQNCLNPDAYSERQSINAFIHVSTKDFGAGERLYVCVLGQNSKGDWQNGRSFSSVSWLKSL